MASIKNTGGCGVDELTGLSIQGHSIYGGGKPEFTPENMKLLLLGICKCMMPYSGGTFAACLKAPEKAKPLKVSTHLLYSGTKGSSYDWQGDLLKLAVETLKLGEVICTKPVTNRLFHPGHKAIAYVWTPDAEALQKWWEKEKPVESVPAPAPLKNLVANPIPQTGWVPVPHPGFYW